MSQDNTGVAEEGVGADVRHGWAWIGDTLKEVAYSVVDGQAVVEGCIVLGPPEEIEYLTANAPSILEKGRDLQGVAIKNPYYRWPNRTVVWEIEDGFDRPERIRDAVAHWEAAGTVLSFVERTVANAANYPDYITFRDGSGCRSAVGCQRGQQFITVGPECKTGNVIHEMGHAIGLFHEQSRSDRDDYVTIHMCRIDPRARHNFTKEIQNGIDLGAYDYGSIMHYPRTAFPADGVSETVTPKDPNVKIGQRLALSPGDIAAVNELYS